MTFETLAYIHRLLTVEEARTNEAYKKSRDYLEELKESRADKATRKEAEETMTSPLNTRPRSCKGGAV